MIYKFYSVLKEKYTEGVDYSFGEDVPRQYQNLIWLKGDKPTESQFNEWATEYNSAEAYKQLRAMRDELLKATDWVTLKHYDLQQPVPTQWAEYRQALRDITLQTPSLDDNGDLILSSVNFPIAP